MQARGEIEAEQATDAETSVEVIARAGRDFRLRGKWTDDMRRARGIGGGGELRGVDHHGINAQRIADDGRVVRHGAVGFLRRFDAEHFADLTAFLEIQSEHDAEMFLEFRDLFQRGGDVFG